MLDNTHRNAINDQHDDGLSHDHGWARDAMGRTGSAGPNACHKHLAALSTPSCATHDDILYA